MAKPNVHTASRDELVEAGVRAELADEILKRRRKGKIDLETLDSVQGVGPVVAEALVDFFHEEHNREALDDLLSEVRPKPFVTDAKQMIVMMVGLLASVIVAWSTLPHEVSLRDALALAGATNRLDCFRVPESVSQILSEKYNVFSGLLGGVGTINPDGSGLQMLTSDGGMPSWSADGSKIAFTSNADGDNEIYVMNAGGTGRVQLTSDDANDQPGA